MSKTSLAFAFVLAAGAFASACTTDDVTEPPAMQADDLTFVPLQHPTVSPPADVDAGVGSDVGSGSGSATTDAGTGSAVLDGGSNGSGSDGSDGSGSAVDAGCSGSP